MGLCYFCKKEVEIIDKVFRKDTCPHCGRDLHSCVQCRFYDRNKHNRCLEPMAQHVTEREKYNFCDYYQFKVGGTDDTDAQTAAKKALDDLFK